MTIQVTRMPGAGCLGPKDHPVRRGIGLQTRRQAAQGSSITAPFSGSER